MLAVLDDTTFIKTGLQLLTSHLRVSVYMVGLDGPLQQISRLYHTGDLIVYSEYKLRI